ncbi:IclR family transcriptional regulator [Halorhabdus amylolytica]|uniref:IclR family transcriptional regulator n=1 Tax=Halorhabdus amylolytica TaxID=2559573 RepID=UPI0010A9F683|nr:IclR family transcriptional regulator [Halorhabdus amylolytica]
MEDTKTIQSVENAIEIIQYISDNDNATLTSIADDINISVSTTHYYLNTLHSNNILRKTDKGYELGYKILEYGGEIKHENDLYMAAKPLMDDISLEIDLPVYLGIEDRMKIVHIGIAYVGRNSIVGDYDGKRTDFHSAALGKAILAYLPNDRQNEIINDLDYPEFTDKTITDPQNLQSDLNRVREKGYAINDEEDFQGWKGIAVPIILENSVEGAISVAGPKSKIDNRKEDILQLLREAKDEIELTLGVDN